MFEKRINLEILKKEPDYKGSVQNLYFLNNYILCETTTGGSVFDVGTIFNIPESDIYRTVIRHLIYSKLNSGEDFDEIYKFFPEDFKISIKTHHIGIIDKKSGEIVKDKKFILSNLTLVKKFKIIKPVQFKIFNKILWDYHSHHIDDNFVIPLENIIRFGITPQSSVYKRFLKADERGKNEILNSLMVENLYPWQKFSKPILDFTTKYEPQDRAVSYQEALYISGLDRELFKKLIFSTYFCAYFVYNFFKKVGLELWDLKLEFAKSGEDIILVDTIDTDSIRITINIDGKRVHFNKQSIRDYFIKFHPDWIKAIEDAKKIAKEKGIDFHEILKEKYPQPPEIDKGFIQLQSKKLKTLVNVLLGKEEKSKLEELAKEELKFFR